jgi:hypothetical protein
MRSCRRPWPSALVTRELLAIARSDGLEIRQAPVVGRQAARRVGELSADEVSRTQ